MKRSPDHVYDAVLIGVGLASTACARALADAGLRVAIVEGVGRSRSLDADGGMVDPDLVSQAFDAAPDEVPLDRPVERLQRFRGDAGSTIVLEEAKRVAHRQAFSRAELEAWALRQAIARGAEYLDGFVEQTVSPQFDGSLQLTGEDGQRHVSARMIALCEGSDPRIAMRVGLRPDYGPEDQVHFAKTLIEASDTLTREGDYLSGTWRTSWGMPVDVAVVPLTSGAVVSVATRIENVMRCSRSAQNALDDLLGTPSARTLVPDGARDRTGVELVAMRETRRPARMSVDTLLMSVEASGMLDPRDPDRPGHAVRAGQVLASFMVDRLSDDGTFDPDETWDDIAMRLVREIVPQRGGYRDSRETGFLEESGASERVMEPVRRLRNSVLTKMRGQRKAARDASGRIG
jgi:electron transfer flavoprotein-quinone oxidoreductase